MPDEDARLGALVGQVRRSRKYRTVAEPLVRRIGAAELRKRASLAEAVKATKNKLHQVAGLYFAGQPDYDGWLRQIAQATDEGARRAALRAIMARHASTHERLPILESFYQRIFAGIAPARSVLDLACGLNPLGLPWMPLAAGATYHAVDIYEDLMDFLRRALALLGAAARAEARDLLAGSPADEADIALLLKAIPCLEQLDPTASAAILDTINARHIVVSFPTRTVGGWDVGMRQAYAARFRALTAGRRWHVEPIAFAGELVFRVTK